MLLQLPKQLLEAVWETKMDKFFNNIFLSLTSHYIVDCIEFHGFYILNITVLNRTDHTPVQYHKNVELFNIVPPYNNCNIFNLKCIMYN